MRASDCVEATSEVHNEGSPLEAADEMEKRIRGATRVIEQGPLLDPHGEPLGERAVLLVKGESNAEIVALYKGKNKLYLIQSSSLAHALAYEKLIQNGYRIDANGYLIAQGK